MISRPRDLGMKCIFSYLFNSHLSDTVLNSGGKHKSHTLGLGNKTV